MKIVFVVNGNKVFPKIKKTKWIVVAIQIEDFFNSI